MNHTSIAAEAIRYRLDLVRGSMVTSADWDIEAMAGATIAAADPSVDGAIRRIATAWVRSGLPAEALCRPWACPEAQALFAANPDLVDALDDIVRVATRSAAA
ncbi:MAG: hypothetical protein AAGA90_13385 [Actinomycetota bacterium]